MKDHRLYGGILFCILLLLSLGPVNGISAQEEPSGVPAAADGFDSVVTPSAVTPVDESTTVYYIRDIDFDITGRTRPFALIYHGELRKGERISGRENLEKYRTETIQRLYNNRVLDSVDIQYTLGPPDADGLVPVDLLIITRDTWNIIALPRPQLDDNIGFDLTIKARDYNFLGTMNPLRVDFGYQLDPEYVNAGFFSNFLKGSANFLIDLDMPFNLWGYNWNLNFDHTFSYIHHDVFQKSHFYYKNVTGISMELPYRFTTFTVGFDESTIVGEENDDRYKDDYGYYYDGTWYMSSAFYGLWKIPTGLAVGDFGELTYTPKITGTVNYRPNGDIGELRRGPSINLSQDIGFGKIDWINNYRKGLEASLTNGNEYNLSKQRWTETLSLSSAVHWPITPWFGVSGRFQYRHWFNDYYDEAGDTLRGIFNKFIAAESILSLNMDLPFKVLDFTPSLWFDKPKLRFFDLEFHLSPFIDMALVKGWERPSNDKTIKNDLSPGDIQVTGGLELIIFWHFMRSLYLRISYGVDLREMAETGKVPEGDKKEFFFGIGHHY
ncbi:MAG: hypothetical protein LBQ38_04645 [Spirochaetaceae bacterium]|nr:hypothetical protein [Spirochaetaceae bacterium]